MEVNIKCKFAKPGEAVVVSALPGKKRGRPGVNLDGVLQERIISMRIQQTAISTSVVVGIGRGLLLKHDRALLDDFGGPIKPNKEMCYEGWALAKGKNQK